MPESARLANQAWEALFTAQSRLLRRFQEQDAFGEVSMSEYDVLYTLAKADGPVRMGELGCSVLLSQPGLSRLVDRLVHRGLVDRSPDPADGRSVLVRLSEAGRAAQKRVGRRHASQVADAMSVLDADELRLLRTLATKLAAEPSGTGTNGSEANVSSSRALTRDLGSNPPSASTEIPAFAGMTRGRTIGDRHNGSGANVSSSRALTRDLGSNAPSASTEIPAFAGMTRGAGMTSEQLVPVPDGSGEPSVPVPNGSDRKES